MLSGNENLGEKPRTDITFFISIIKSVQEYTVMKHRDIINIGYV